MIFKYDPDLDSFHGEWCPVDEEITKEEAEKYLTLWIKIFLKKNKVQLMDHQFIYRPELKESCVKICVRNTKNK